MSWRSDLAATALAWGTNCLFDHSPFYWGENLAMGASYNPTGLTNAWYQQEVCSYDYTKPGFKEATGHFTQVVWAGTLNVGCAMVGPDICPNGFRDYSSGHVFNGWMLTCEYDAPGNAAGQFPVNVMPPTQPLPQCKSSSPPPPPPSYIINSRKLKA